MASIGSNVLSSRKGRCGDDLHLEVVRVSKSKRRRVSGVAALVFGTLFSAAIILRGDDYGDAPATCYGNKPLMRPKTDL